MGAGKTRQTKGLNPGQKSLFGMEGQLSVIPVLVVLTCFQKDMEAYSLQTTPSCLKVKLVFSIKQRQMSISFPPRPPYTLPCPPLVLPPAPPH